MKPGFLRRIMLDRATETVSMRQCLALAWLIGVCSVAWANDDDVTGLFRTVRATRASQFFRIPVDDLKFSTRNPIFTNATRFRFKTDVVAGDPFVRFVDLPQDEEPDATVDAADSGFSRITVPAPPDDGTTEQVFPLRASERPINSSNEAIPLDNAPRDNGKSSSKHEPTRLASSRSSFAWIAGTNDQLGMLELDFEPLSRARFDSPTPHLFFVDTTFGAKWLTGPNSTDLPPQLFNVLINLGTTHRVSDRTIVDAMLSPGWYTDFSNKGIEAFRLPWHVVSYSQTFSFCQTVLGVTDLARDDIHLLPVAGLIFAAPESALRLDLVFPRPRVAWRCYQADAEESWLYLGGELGGGSYAISRADRSYDTVTYSDYRLTTGFETRKTKGHATRLEAGWIFNRSVSYRSDLGNYSPPDSLMIRISSDY